jgi:hypothetical protein
VIKSRDEGKPLRLDLWATMNKEVVSFHHLVLNNLERVAEFKFLCLQALFLLLNELIQTIELFLYGCKSCRVNLLKFIIDSKMSLLELLDLFENFLAFTAASINKCISSSTPVESLDTWLNSAIKLI